MLSGFGSGRACVMERAMREEYERLSQQAALGETFTFAGYSKEHLTFMIEAVERYTSGNLRSKHPKEVYSMIRNAITKKAEPKRKTKEELAEHLHNVSMYNLDKMDEMFTWKGSSEKVKDYYRDMANELIVKSWEASQCI